MKKGKELKAVMSSERSKARTSNAATQREAEKKRIRQQVQAPTDIFVAETSRRE